MEPEPATCKKVLLFLQNVLKNLCLSARGIQYEMCIRCSCSEECQRMHLVKHINKDEVHCGEHIISIKRYCKLFGDLTAKVVGSSGGDLKFEEIKLVIPAGAIAEGEHVDILLGQLNATEECKVPFANNLESRISPIVSCGPSGKIFNKHCTLSFPHNAINKESWEFTVYVNENYCDDWKRIECDDQNTKVSILDGRCCVETEHFSCYCLTGKVKILSHCKKKLQLGLYGKMLGEGYYLLRVRVWSKHDYKVMTAVKLLYSTRFIHTTCKYLQTIVMYIQYSCKHFFVNKYHCTPWG
ncbi:netrin receptor UNC5B-like [Anneissia japonica]|uniref:netrin receptor UNC5B-like n=1 Tax=Anneissia japonica TaxID=1529436 RepID=UPI001425A792|nr:netrin receptor UNC5B-like [Anneissia japonica]